MGTAKRYAIFSAQYPPHLGGIERFTYNLAHALGNRGDEVTVVTNDTEGMGAGECIEDGVSIVRLPCAPLVSGRLPLPIKNARYRALVWGIASQAWDGVLINARFYPHSLLGMKVARGQGLCPVVLDHGSAYLSFSNAVLDLCVRAYEHAMTWYGRRRYHPAYFGISRKSMEWLGTFGISARGVIGNSIDARAFRENASSRDFRAELGLNEGAFVVAFVGRLIPEKGIDHIIEASRFPELRKRQVVFVLAGSGPLQQRVESAQGDGLRFVGALDPTDVSALFQASDVLCLPTRSEGFSTTLLEASACGLSSIVTDVGGASELIPDDSHGAIISEASADAIVREVARLASDSALQGIRSRSCRELVESGFSWDATARALEDAFDQVRAS